ncbi:MAG: HNH endonuclease [Pyrinomonadaceae bacterium]|nr:HNH endonuclease [Pyrinomonadaceae bacterium]
MSVHNKGKNSARWKGGGSRDIRHTIMGSREYKDWRKSVYDRDGYTCQHCGDDKGGNLHAHHIKPVALYPELIFEVDNGLTLCNPCHVQLHKQMPSLHGKSRLREFISEAGYASN